MNLESILKHVLWLYSCKIRILHIFIQVRFISKYVYITSVLCQQFPSHLRGVCNEHLTSVQCHLWTSHHHPVTPMVISPMSIEFNAVLEFLEFISGPLDTLAVLLSCDDESCLVTVVNTNADLTTRPARHPTGQRQPHTNVHPICNPSKNKILFLIYRKIPFSLRMTFLFIYKKKLTCCNFNYIKNLRKH